MVHLRGRLTGRPGTEDRGPGQRRQTQQRWLARAGVSRLIAVVGLLLGGATSPATAQSAIGFQGGVAADPEQVFGGVFFQSGDIGYGFRLRPGIDGAAGQGLRIATIGVDFVYGYPLGGNGWTLLAGGGPAVVVTRFTNFDERDTGVGFHSIVGFGHESGFFTELRLGSGQAQRLKFGVGWAIVLD